MNHLQIKCEQRKWHRYSANKSENQITISDTNNDDQHIANIKVVFCVISETNNRYSSPSLVIQLRIQGKELYFLIHTGACRNIFSNSMIRNLNLTPNVQQIDTYVLDVNNHKFQITGKIAIYKKHLRLYFSFDNSC